VEPITVRLRLMAVGKKKAREILPGPFGKLQERSD
jgi:hypothetical protein